MRLESYIQSVVRPIWKLRVHKILENHTRTKGHFMAFYSKIVSAAQDDSMVVDNIDITTMNRAPAYECEPMFVDDLFTRTDTSLGSEVVPDTSAPGDRMVVDGIVTNTGITSILILCRDYC